MSSAATCSVAGCDRSATRRGWCSRHYQRWYKTGDPEGVRPGRWDGYVRPTCSVVGCADLAHAHGMCATHVARWNRHGDPEAGRRQVETGTDDERFAAMFERGEDGECWLWTAGCTPGGYGLFHFNGGPVYAHRWAYRQAVGPVPDGLVIDHVCHNIDPDCPGGVCDHRRCVNPAHLEPVTIPENFRRGRERTKV